jgi:GntR family transcriptional regulator/MocR family aminotransferase
MRLTLFFDEDSPVPIYRQLAEHIEELVTSGQLRPGTRLPSSRELAESAGVSRCTASKVYELLEFRRYIETLPAVGTFVCREIPGRESFAPAERKSVSDPACLSMDLSRYGQRILSSESIEPADIELFPELNYCAPPAEHLPLTKWHEILIQAARKRDLLQHSYRPDPLGNERLRRALADYVLRTRGIRCTYEQIALFSGAQAALDLLARLLLNDGDAAAVEDPGFPGIRRTLASHGVRAYPVSVDRDGLVLDHLAGLTQEVKLVYVTPSHHDPTGVVLSNDRRRQLLRWAESRPALIVEDDFDNDFRYAERPLPPLYAMAGSASVIYLSSFWKVMFPVVQLGFVVLPPALVPAVARAKSLIERDFHFLEHEALARFIDEGHLERHVRRTRGLYSRRRLELIAQLNKHLGSLLRISPVSAGTHLLVHTNVAIPDEELLLHARRAGLAMVSTRPYYATNPMAGEFLIPFAHIDEASLSAGVERLAALVKTQGQPALPAPAGLLAIQPTSPALSPQHPASEAGCPTQAGLP